MSRVLSSHSAALGSSACRVVHKRLRLDRFQEAQHARVLKARRERPYWLQRAVCNPALPTQCSQIQLGAVATLAASPAEPAASIWQPVQRASARPPARISPPSNGLICKNTSMAHTMHEEQSMDEEEVHTRSFCRLLSTLVYPLGFFTPSRLCPSGIARSGTPGGVGAAHRA